VKHDIEGKLIHKTNITEKAIIKESAPKDEKWDSRSKVVMNGTRLK
jgi:hypothetical protein